MEPVGDLGLVLRGGRRRLLGLAAGDGEVLGQRPQLVEHLLVLARPQVHELAPLDRRLDVVGAQDGGRLVEGPGVDVGLDGDLGEGGVEPVDLGLGLLLAAAGGGELGLGGGGRLLRVGEGGLLAGDVRLEGGEGLLDLGVLGPQHVDLGGVVGPLLADALALLARVPRGAGRGAGDRRHHGNDERPQRAQPLRSMCASPLCLPAARCPRSSWSGDPTPAGPS